MVGHGDLEFAEGTLDNAAGSGVVAIEFDVLTPHPRTEQVRLAVVSGAYRAEPVMTATLAVEVSSSTTGACAVGQTGKMLVQRTATRAAVSIRINGCGINQGQVAGIGRNSRVQVSLFGQCLAPKGLLVRAAADTPSCGTDTTLTITLGGATETRDLKTGAPTPPVGSAGASAHLKSGPAYAGTTAVGGTLPAGYTVYVFYHSAIWQVLGPEGGPFMVQEAAGFGASNDVEAWACVTGGTKGGSLPTKCLYGEGTDISIYWSP